MNKKENGVVGLEIMGGQTLGKKTLFPTDWNDDDVVNLGTFIKDNPSLLKMDGDKFDLIYKDRMGRDIPMSGYFESGTKNLTTFYPVYESR